MVAKSEPRLVTLDVADYPAILGLWQRAGLSVRPKGRDSQSSFARQMSWGTQRVVGFRADGQLVAVVVLTHDGRKGWINRLAVDPDCRRQGLASTLVEEAERWFTRDLGLEIWAALIEQENAASQALFDHLGYRSLDLQYVSKRVREDA
jgi:ribosomal protein S18 acetylase RimI-like enzyme